MLTRLVRMEFRPEATAAFLDIFNASKQAIRAFPGCLHLELHRDATEANVYYTYSRWRDPADLEAYRTSELFAHTWAATKVLFAARPLAFSLAAVETVTPPPQTD